MLLDDYTQLQLPPVPAGITWDDLDLSPKTHSIIASILERPENLNSLSIAQLLANPGIRKRNIYDLLFAIQACRNERRAPDDAALALPDQQEWPKRSVLSFQELTAARAEDCPSKLKAKYLPAAPPEVVFSDPGFSLNSRGILRRAHSVGLIRCPADLGRLRLREILEFSNGRLDHVRELVRTLQQMSAAVRKLEEVSSAATELLSAPYAESVHSADVRFGSDVLSIARGVANAKEAAASVLGGYRHGKLLKIARLKTRLEHAASMKLEAELADIVSATVRKRAAGPALLSLLGWDGTGLHSGPDVARQFGTTRQGVSALRQRVFRMLSNTKQFAPALDRALDAVEFFVPGPAETAERHLLSAGITQGSFDLTGIQTAAAALGRTPSFTLEQCGRRLFLLTAHAEQEYERALGLARATVRREGVCSMENLIKYFQTDLPEGFLRSRLEQHPAFVWLDEPTSWFCFIDNLGSSRIIRAIRKILAISRKVRVSELRMALSRRSKSMPTYPEPMLLRLCAQIPGVSVDGALIRAESDSLYARTELPSGKRVLVEVMLQGRGPMDSADIIRRCVARGVGRANVLSLLQSSPIVLRVGRGRYVLIGSADS